MEPPSCAVTNGRQKLVGQPDYRGVLGQQPIKALAGRDSSLTLNRQARHSTRQLGLSHGPRAEAAQAVHFKEQPATAVSSIFSCSQVRRELATAYSVYTTRSTST